MRALRWRRRRYALVARRHRALGRLTLPVAVSLPGGRRLERYAYLYWRVRLPLWAGLTTAGWLTLGVLGVIPGLAAASAAELALSYRLAYGAAAAATSGPGPDTAGVREPRPPRPSGGDQAGQRPVGPARPGVD